MMHMQQLPTYTLPDDRYAVVLNANAGRVTPRVARALSKVVPEGRLFLTESREHAKDVFRNCLDQKVGTVFAGGGDGTIVDTINTLRSLAGEGTQLPSVGVLRLGTGNALAHWLGSGRPVRDLRRWEAGQVHRSVPIQMVEAEGTLFPFAGLGIDAAILNDYNLMKQRAHGKWWGKMAKGISGYLLAGYTRTMPQALLKPTQMVSVTNMGRPAFRIGPNGREIGPPIPHGAVIYEGPVSAACCATMPYYGYGMKMFPHATKRAGRFQLRLIRMSPLRMAMKVPMVWKGGTPDGVLDFYADRVGVQFAEDMPYQLGGEAKGYRREVVFSMAKSPVTLVGQA
jgi:diacylglycerol kinase family enzyme